VSFTVDRGEILGLVGESGSGKSVTAMSILGLVPSPGSVAAGEVTLNGRNLLTLKSEELQRIRGHEIALVPQNPMTSLDPVFTIGWQMREVLRDLNRQERDERVADALSLVGIPEPLTQLHRYPHEFSGGGRQRILIAMAMLNNPSLLIADEPTTALDVTIQAQVLALIEGLTDRIGMGVLLITHNMGVVASVCDRVAVMYAGEIVEIGSIDEVLGQPWHPYTRALLKSTPSLGAAGVRIEAIEGSPPDLRVPLQSCRFMSRCPLAEDGCKAHPALEPIDGSGHQVRCFVTKRDARSGNVEAAKEHS